MTKVKTKMKKTGATVLIEARTKGGDIKIHLRDFAPDALDRLSQTIVSGISTCAALYEQHMAAQKDMTPPTEAEIAAAVEADRQRHAGVNGEIKEDGNVDEL